jgi:hypothetical protein
MNPEPLSIEFGMTSVGIIILTKFDVKGIRCSGFGRVENDHFQHFMAPTISLYKALP